MRLLFAAPFGINLMPLPQPIARRALRHTRAITVEAFAREDGLWDLDAHITDIKTWDATFASGIRAAGDPVHDLRLRITIDRQMNVVDACAASDAVPYPGHCDTVAPAYAKLVGLNLMQGFRHALRERLHGILGCTHLTELAQILPTAAVQAFAGDEFHTGDAANDRDPEIKPFQLDRCHALRTDGLAVAKYYPRWTVGHTGDAETIPSI
jgi:hypothetical protein